MNPYEYFNIFNQNSDYEIDFNFPRGYDKELAEYKKIGLSRDEIQLLREFNNNFYGIIYTFKEWFELPNNFKTELYKFEPCEKYRSGLFNWYSKCDNQKKEFN